MQTSADMSSFIISQSEQNHNINLVVEGMRCASCAWQIETTLNKQEAVQARVN
jgi:hypothetical protein